MGIDVNFWTWFQFICLLTLAIVSQEVNSSTTGDNRTIIPNQVYHPLGSCPCDLASDVCVVPCCCDRDCSLSVKQLFESHCLLGPLGGAVDLVPEYQCSNPAPVDAPDWFSFLCVTSPAENNPLLGHFYSGNTVPHRGSPSFRSSERTVPLPVSSYRQGGPIFTATDAIFTIPQGSLLGQCLESAPVAFLENFQTECVSFPSTCTPFPTNLATDLSDGNGGIVTINVTNELLTDSTLFWQWTGSSQNDSTESESSKVLCKNVTMALNYTFYWRGGSLSEVTLLHSFGDFSLEAGVPLITKVSAVFLNGDNTAQSHSGTSGYLVGRPVVGGVVMSPATVVRRAAINLWNPGGSGLCEAAGLRPVNFGVNSTSGCMFSVSLDNFTDCRSLRNNAYTVLASLVTATVVARKGNPSFNHLSDWVDVKIVQNSSTSVYPESPGLCEGVPSQLHVVIFFTGGLHAEISTVEVHIKPATWKIHCDTGSKCQNVSESQSFPLTSSVTFAELLSIPLKTRFQINFTEFDCDRNDVCWPELAFPLTRFYTGESSSLALAKGMVLVFLFLIASLLGSPWRQIRQAWSNTEF
ncbi:tectonic-2 [Engraulis encrasicolus]|uniref:tectonic-2 n=1 Tax=Engraulis encrasicolus TaxID=184585 RepID=UPI002FD2505C